MKIAAHQTTARTLTDLAADRHHPVSYTRADGSETLRTIEIHDIRTTKAGAIILCAADRTSGEMRTWRLDRIQAYAIHRTAYTVALPEAETETPAPPRAATPPPRPDSEGDGVPHRLCAPRGTRIHTAPPTTHPPGHICARISR